MDVTLSELLQSRDDRHRMHLDLLNRHPGLTLVSVTMVMPGPVKSNAISIALADKAQQFLLSCRPFLVENLIRRDLNTGSEIYFLSRLPLADTKRMCCRVEDEHPLGRLWDFDVIRPDSTPLSRTEIGLPARKCILCGDDAITCIRGRRHTVPELYARVEQLFTENKDLCYEF